MRLLIVFAFSCLLTACAATNKSKTGETAAATPPPTEGYAEPTDLEGPAYDPSTSPQPMTANTVLPKPPGYTPPNAERPAAYSYGFGTQTNDSIRPASSYAQPAPAAYGTPAAYGSSTDIPEALYPKGTEAEAAPTTYSNGVAQPPVGEAAQLAAQLTGLWTNTADEREVVEFTVDHYSTFYDGELLLQEAMQYHASCPGDCSGGTPLGISCFTISGPAGTDCYGIVRLTPEVLELSMLGVSTETIVYTKK